MNSIFLFVEEDRKHSRKRLHEYVLSYCKNIYCVDGEIRVENINVLEKRYAYQQIEIAGEEYAMSIFIK